MERQALTNQAYRLTKGISFQMKSIKSFDVVVVGAGAAGVGVGMALKRVGVKSMILLERGTVGESFRR